MMFGFYNDYIALKMANAHRDDLLRQKTNERFLQTLFENISQYMKPQARLAKESEDQR